MKHYQLFIFDWDGTLMNTTQTIVEATKDACTQTGLPLVSDEAAKSIIGKSFVEVVADIVPELEGKPGLLQQFTAIYERYLNEHTNQNPLFNDVVELLDFLERDGRLLAIATGRSRQMLEDILDATGCRKYFVATKTACECFSKPHPQMIEDILAFTGVSKDAAVMIGDTNHDVQMAHNAGVDAIAVSHGAQDRLMLEQSSPRYLLNSISELYGLLCTS